MIATIDIAWNVFATGGIFFSLLLTLPSLLKDCAPDWVKFIVVVSGILGLAAMVLSILVLIWAPTL